MIIDVTQADIDNGREKTQNPEVLVSQSCPVALAVKRISGRNVSVSTKAMHIWDDHRINQDTFSLPPEAITFINAFDRDHEVGPFSFEVS